MEGIEQLYVIHIRNVSMYYSSLEIHVLCGIFVTPTYVHEYMQVGQVQGCQMVYFQTKNPNLG
jgi:hypothetical protein